MVGLSFVDVCTGGGGLALGLEQAGFTPTLLLDNKPVACETVRLNRPKWSVVEADLRSFDPTEHPESLDVDLLSAGLPRVRSSATILRSGSEEELELLRATVYLTHAVQPRALIVENVPALVTDSAYDDVRAFVRAELEHLGYELCWFVLNAADFGVPQVRRQGLLVALRRPWSAVFRPPVPTVAKHTTVGQVLRDSMASRCWHDAGVWAAQADEVAPTLVGGSENRGGADLGPRGTKRAWARMGVNSGSLADELPGPEFDWDPDQGASGMVRLTVDQTARLQAFPDEWRFAGRKTARYRQIGHASPPPVGRALGLAVASALSHPAPGVAGYTSTP
ncbi:DNA cytosine methyltransferase [Streptomyces sp. NPDC017941]|uniref:DNA cytosine methyltransferase n=1 Tax=Streptomyces sp. NPDC017941 TaxID=3365018 RepID=UPI0037973708